MTNKTTKSLMFYLAALILFPTATPFNTALAKDWFAKPEAGGTCERDNPCLFSQAVGVAQNGDSVYFQAGTYKNPTVNPYVIYISRNLNLVGGWNGAPSGELVIDPEAYPTILDGEGARRVIEIDGNFGSIAPKISGFTITNGNASGMAINCSGLNANGCGGGIFVYLAAAHIVNNKIVNNRAHTILDQFGYGGGLHLEMASGAVIENNLIQDNNASQAGPGAGGGLSIYGVTQSSPKVIGNRFIKNSGLMSGGASIGWQYNPIIQNNIFDNNSAQ